MRAAARRRHTHAAQPRRARPRRHPCCARPQVFAYGVTGSGKTHTMMGDSEGDEGLVQRTIKELFSETGKRTDRWARGAGGLLAKRRGDPSGCEAPWARL